MITIYKNDGKVTRIEVNQVGKNAVLAEYNRLMARIEKASEYMSYEKEPASEKEKWVPLFQKLTYEISAVLDILQMIGERWEEHKWLK